MAVAVIEGAMATLAPRPVEPDGDPFLRASLLTDLALAIERDSDAYTMLTGVGGRLEEIYAQDEG